MKPGLLLVVGLAVVGLACSDETDPNTSDTADRADAAAVEDTMMAARDALAAGDVAAFMELWTDSGLESAFHESGDAFVANAGYYLGAKQYSLGALSEPIVAGDTATTVGPLFFRLVGVVREFSLIKVDGVWKVNGTTLTTADPGEAVVIDVEFGESSITFNSSAVVDGNIALQVHNSTSQTHELNILTAPPDRDLTSFFEHPELEPPLPEGRSMPEGFDFVGGVSAIEPGATVTIVFSQVLPAARYVMFCNADDDSPAGAHSKRGEFAEFAID